ncbi:ABC transporter permease [Variovorax sp. KBS0712]|uniref:ABC transporter permease n=1 Tax=Variovorax sp. KBS0712 TaxID=2578111 RepID=UPI001117BCF5|nr:ABC transporter permease [Variovorax sp. KBS0712]TSD59532.1 ABC transporter permease [Variovorax sp. KBS0712]
MSAIAIAHRGAAVRSFGAMPGVAWVLLVLLLAFSLLAPNFLTAGNVNNIAQQSVVLLLLALPTTLVIMTEGIDMSLGAVLSLAGVVLAMVLVASGSPMLAVGAAMGVGLAFGLANGALVSVLGLPPFIVTLGAMGIAQGLALVATDGDSIITSESLAFLFEPVAGLTPTIWIALAFYAVFHVLMHRTRLGFYASAIGGNPEALRFASVNLRLYHIGIYALSGAAAGFAALVMTARMSAGHPSAALGLEFDAIAAVIVGGTSFEHGKGRLFGTLIGVVAVGVLRNGLNLLNVSSAVQVSCIGLLVIASLLLDNLKGTK